MSAEPSSMVPLAPDRLSAACRAGHPYSAENTYRRSDGVRQCKTCNRAAVSAYRRRRLRERGEEIRAQQRQDYAANVEVRRTHNRGYAKVRSSTLTDPYVRQLLLNCGFAPEAITPGLIELKRVTTLIKRQLWSRS
jgi:hypothetical protein